MTRALLAVLIVATGLAALHLPAAAYDYRALHLLRDRHTHMILRLSEAPPEGDLPERGRADCNDVTALGREGRKLAAGFARALNRSSIGFSDIFSSQICRNIHAAEILHLGPVKVRPALDPLPPEGTERTRQLDALYALIEERRPAETVLLLTHQDVITALTGEELAVGEALIFRLKPFGDVEVRARAGLPPI